MWTDWQALAGAAGAASWSGAERQLVVPLRLLSDYPTSVAGDRAFVLFAEGVGRLEVGAPLPGSEIWNHFEGDLIYTTFQPTDDSGLTGGGGEAWDDPKLSVMWSQPEPGDDQVEAAWVVVGRVPEQFRVVLARQGDVALRQEPIRGHAVLPLDNAGPQAFEIVGIDPQGVVTLLFNTGDGVVDLAG